MQMTAATGIKTTKDINAFQNINGIIQSKIWSNIKYFPQLLQ